MKNTIKTKDAKKGGYLVGKPHSEGGIKGINTDTGEPIEVEGGEVVITKPAVDSSKRYNFEGKEMTPKEILSRLNSDHGGVAFKDGGEVPKAKYGLGGSINGGDDEFLDVWTNHYKGKKYLTNTNDDFNLEVQEAKVAELLNNNIVVKNKENSTFPFSSCIFIGSFLYIKPYGSLNNASIDDKGLFGIDYYTKFIENKSYNFYIPYQVKRFEISGNNIVNIVLGRIVDGVYGEFKLNSIYQSADRVILMPNPLIDLPANFETSDEIIYPQNIPNVIEYADNIGQWCLTFNSPMNSDLANYAVREYLYPIHDDNYLIRDTDGAILVKKYVLLVNDTAEIEFHVEDKFVEVESYEMDEATYYSYVAKGTAIYTASNIFLGQRAIIKLLGIVTQNTDKHNDFYYKSIIFEANGKIYANFKKDEEYGYDMRLINLISRGEPENRFDKKVYTELEKNIRKVRSKQETNKSLYQKLLQITDGEISKFSTFRGLIDTNNIPRRNEIDRKLAQLQDDRDMFALKLDTGLELLDKFADLENQEKEEMSSGLTTNLAINGQPSELTDRQWHKVRTPNFLSWFGNWEKAYEVGNYGNVSKAINERTSEPIVLYHGSKADFVKWRFNEFPAAYFADNRSYSQWFANMYSGGTLYQVFLDIKNPIDVRIFGTDQRPLREYLDYLQVNYKIDYYDAYPKIKQYEAGGQQAVDELLDTPLRFWEFIRHWNVDFLTFLRDMTFYDGIIMYENNPSDQINGQDNVTGSYVVFKNDQIKWASANHFVGKVNDARFALGGRIEQDNQRSLLKNMDFVI